MFRTTAIRSGLRIKVERGTAMDIGMYNALPERRKLTIEMMVSLLEDPNVKRDSKTDQHWYSEALLSNQICWTT